MKLVITEKYNQGEVVKSAVCDSPEKKTIDDEPYWEGDDVVVIPLSGQVFELQEVETRNGYPDFPDLDWEVKDEHAGKMQAVQFFLESSELDECIIGTDVDREGELIGTLAVLLGKWGDVTYQIGRAHV